MAPETILERVKRLLALAQSDNEHEASLALARAEELMAEHNIKEAELAEADRETASVDGVPLYSGKRIPGWVCQLAITVSENAGCYMYSSRCYSMEHGTESHLIITGNPSDRDAARAMFAWIRSVIERLSVINCKGKGRAYASSWCLGAAIGVRDTLLAAKRVREAEAPRMASAGLITLDKVKAARVAVANAGINLVSAGRGSGASNGSAFRDGRTTGQSISTSGNTLGGSRGAIGMR